MSLLAATALSLFVLITAAANAAWRDALAVTPDRL